MSVISMRSKTCLGEFRFPESDETASERTEFFAGAVLTIAAPTLLFCMVIGQTWPLYLMACNGGVGVVLGLLMFRKMSDESPLGLNLTRTHRMPLADLDDEEKAA